MWIMDKSESLSAQPAVVMNSSLNENKYFTLLFLLKIFSVMSYQKVEVDLKNCNWIVLLEHIKYLQLYTCQSVVP